MGVLGESCIRGFSDELEKIGEARKELPLKSIAKNVLLATAGGLVGLQAGKAVEWGVRKAVGNRKIPPAALKYVAPILGMGVAGLTLYSQAKAQRLAHEMVYGSDSHE